VHLGEFLNVHKKGRDLVKRLGVEARLLDLVRSENLNVSDSAFTALQLVMLPPRLQ
jgi:hypothetical protein